MPTKAVLERELVETRAELEKHKSASETGGQSADTVDHTLVWKEVHAGLLFHAIFVAALTAFAAQIPKVTQIVMAAVGIVVCIGLGLLREARTRDAQGGEGCSALVRWSAHGLGILFGLMYLYLLLIPAGVLKVR